MKILKKINRILLAIISFSLILSVCSCERTSINNDTPEHTPERRYPTVIIDAGHGGEDCGAIGINGCYEKDLNLSIAVTLSEMLEAAGIRTRLTRDTDTLLYDREADYEGRKKILDMKARENICAEYGDAIFISIHMNSFPIEKYSGLQVYYSQNDGNSRVLAEAIQGTVRKNLQYKNTRSTKPSGEEIYLLYRAAHPAVLVECGFLSNREECELLCTEAYQKRLCMCIFAAVMNYFSTSQNNNSQIS